MKILGINFSGRDNGNCANCIRYCMDELGQSGYDTEIINISDFDISPCGNCDYACFKSKCQKTDGMSEIVACSQKADKIIFALPTYRGHLSSSYFTFSERLEGISKAGIDLDEIMFKKANLIIIGNLSAGGDMALHEALYEFANKPYTAETLLLSSREYGRRSINGDLIEEELVKERLRKFIQAISKLQ